MPGHKCSVAMAAHATRSASGAASSNDDASRCLLLALSHDELGVIVDGLADPLQPVVAVAFSSTCKGLRTPPVLERARLILVQRYFRALALCHKVNMSCVELREENDLEWNHRLHDEDQDLTTDHASRVWNVKGLTADDMATLGMILRTNGLPRLQRLILYNNHFGDEGAQALFEGLGPGSLPSLVELDLECNHLGPAGAEALAAALRRGAMPKLVRLDLCINTLGNQGFAALAPQIRKLPALSHLALNSCGLNDTDVASLFANLGKDDFKALSTMFLGSNPITDVGHSTLVKTLDGGGMPSIQTLYLHDNPASDEARQAVIEAVDRAIARVEGVSWAIIEE